MAIFFLLLLRFILSQTDHEEKHRKTIKTHFQLDFEITQSNLLLIIDDDQGNNVEDADESAQWTTTDDEDGND